jgi:hypothetical protein
MTMHWPQVALNHILTKTNLTLASEKTHGVLPRVLHSGNLVHNMVALCMLYTITNVHTCSYDGNGHFRMDEQMTTMDAIQHVCT